MKRIKQPEYLNALTEAQKNALEQEGYKVLCKYKISHPETGEILEKGWEMKLKESGKCLVNTQQKLC